MLKKIHISLFIVLLTAHSIAQTEMNNGPTIRFLFPVSIEIDPMEKLLLINFEKDPDSVYIGFEPQVFNDQKNGTGHLIIGWRKDLTIDVYHQKSLRPDPLKYSIAGAGLNRMIPVDTEIASFELNESGVQAHYQFDDYLGRKVEIVIMENHPKKRKPFGLLAPMGDAATHPSAMPLVLLHDFYFVRKSNSVIKVAIDNKTHRIDDLPMRMDGTKMTFARYSPSPLIATFNPAFDGKLESILLVHGQQILENERYIYEFVWIDQLPALKSLSIKNDIHMLSVHFHPAFPCMSIVPDDTVQNGSINISGHPSLGSIAGSYSIRAQQQGLHIQITPSKGWKPRITKFSTAFLFTVARVFKKWPTTYQWDATVQKNKEGEWHMQSSWSRTNKIMN